MSFRSALLASTISAVLAVLAPADEVVRIMAANTSSGNDQSYDAGHGSRIFDGLNPDVALVQEMNVSNNSAAAYRTWVDTYFGSTFSYFVESGKSIPNGIVSRYPILTSGVWNDSDLSDREFVWARIDLPGDMNLLAVSVHLKASSGSDNVSRRQAQAVQLAGYIAGEKKATDHVVIGGDFNTQNRTESCVTALSSTVVTTAPWPADQAGNTNTNSSQGNPYDWVMPSSSLAAFSTPLVIGPNIHTNGLVFDSRDYTPLSAVTPVQSTDSGATGMQHMAVMRAFLIPTNDLPVITAGTSVAVTLSRNNTPTAFSRSLTATDADGDPLTWTISTQAAHGTAGIVAPASGGTVALSYTPATNYTGSDSFVVQVADGQGGTDTITVNLTIQPPANVSPVITQGDSVTVILSRDGYPTAFQVAVSATDADSDPLSWTVSTAALHGTAAITTPSGASPGVSYQPLAGYLGADSFRLQVSDGKGGIDEILVQVTVVAPPAYDSWTYDDFAPLTPETEVTVWGENADPDGDGLTNLEEFAHGTDPEVADGSPALITARVEENGDLLLSYLVRLDGSAPALDYTIESTVGLTGPWAELAASEYEDAGTTSLAGGVQRRTIRLTAPLGETRRFFRLTFTR